MDKVICFTNDKGGVSIVNPTPEMFDTLSRTRWSLRVDKNIDFSDGVAMNKWIENIISQSNENNESISYQTAISLYAASSDYEINKSNAEHEILEWIANKDVPEGKEFKLVDKDAIPRDRYFRDAWSLEEDALQVDIEKAKPIQIDKIRTMRVSVFPNADFDFNKAVEKVLVKLIALLPEDSDMLDLVAKIQKRQALRDATDIDLSEVSDLHELKESIPDVLK